MRTIELVLPSLHPKQKEFIDSKYRFNVAACGTKFGKTFGNSVGIVKDAWNKVGPYWWVAPIYKQTMIGYNLIKQMIPYKHLKEYKSDKLFEISNGSTIEFKSADDPNSLRGFAPLKVKIDEAARIKEEAFISILTTVTKTGGGIDMMTTPKGRNWVYRAWLRGRLGNTKYPNWRSWQLKTTDNPHVPKEFVEEAQKILPDALFRQEYEAEFLEDVARVFRNIEACAIAKKQDKPHPARRYIIGWDLAKHSDYSVAGVADTVLNEVVDIETWLKKPYELQIELIKNKSQKWNNASVIMDSHGVGDPLLERLQGKGVPAEGYDCKNNALKRILVESLILSLENIAIKYIWYQLLLDELEIFESIISPTGVVTYKAPAGWTDDHVTMLALVNYKLKPQRKQITIPTIDGWPADESWDEAMGDF